MYICVRLHDFSLIKFISSWLISKLSSWISRFMDFKSHNFYICFNIISNFMRVKIFLVCALTVSIHFLQKYISIKSKTKYSIWNKEIQCAGQKQQRAPAGAEKIQVMGLPSDPGMLSLFFTSMSYSGYRGAMGLCWMGCKFLEYISAIVFRLYC